MFNQDTSPQPKVYIIHENDEWTAPLIDALTARGIAFENWDMSKAVIDMSKPAPEGIFYNRMSASSHTRGNRFAPEVTVGVLAWLETQGRKTFNGRSALNLEISKLVQYAALYKAGLNVPHTIAVTRAEDVVDAYAALPYDDVITKHNRAGKGLGVQLLKSPTAAEQHISSAGYEDSVDGITLVQQYIEPQDSSITRVEFIGQEFFYAVKVDTSNGFELCPADACSLDGGICATNQEPTYPFEIIEGFENTDAGLDLLPKMRAVMEAEGLDVAGFEFVTGHNGQHFCYDINTNTNYNSDAEARGGQFAMQRLADFLGEQLAIYAAVQLKEAS